MLKTRNIFIDTEVFVSNNFFQNKNLERLSDFGNREIVNLYLTEITKHEIQNNIKENLLNAQQDINNFKKIIANKSKILKNLESFKPYFDLPRLEVNLNFDQLSVQLETFIKEGKVKIIPFNLANIIDVVDSYFNQKPPFSSGKKKYEFPDAIVLSAIENWCKQENEQIYVISDDNDFKSYVSGKIITIPSIKIMLDKINKQYQTDEIAWITSIFEINKKSIIEKINEKFIEKISDEIGFEIEISNIQIKETILYDALLVEENPPSGEYIFQLDYDIVFTARVIYDDYSFSSYDKEDDKYYFVEKAQREIEMATTQTAEISLEAYFEDGGKPEDADVYLNCIYTSIPNESKISDHLENDYDLY